MKQNLTKSDIVWAYAAKGLNICSGIIVLPLILRLLSKEEIATNYVLNTIMSIVALFDFGFSPQFSRNFSYIFSGATEIKKQGIPISSETGEVNYGLLSQLILAAKLLYKIISAIVCLLLLTAGTWYFYHFSKGFSIINSCFPLWIFFIFSLIFDFYYRYFSTILTGQGQVSIVNKIDVIANFSRILIICCFLICGFGLWSIVIGNFSRLFITRVLSYKTFFTQEIKEKLFPYKDIPGKQWETLGTLWYNAKKTMFVCIATYASSQLSFFFSSLYLSTDDIASYGLLNQFLIIITSFSMNVCYSMTPIYSSLRAQNKENQIKNNFYFSMGTFYVIQILASLFLLLIIPHCLVWIKSNASLPCTLITSIVLLYKFLENQHCVCSCYLTTQNKIIDFESSIIISIVNFFVFWSILSLTNWGLLGLVLVQLIIPLLYPNWKWPFELCKEFQISYYQLVRNSFVTVNSKVSILWKSKN